VFSVFVIFLVFTVFCRVKKKLRILITENKINPTCTVADMSDEELILRKEEDELFSKLTSMIPTRLEGVSDILGEVTDEQVLEQRAKYRKKQATIDAKRDMPKRKRIVKTKADSTDQTQIDIKKKNRLFCIKNIFHEFRLSAILWHTISPLIDSSQFLLMLRVLLLVF
jgi:hypothetical protein